MKKIIKYIFLALASPLVLTSCLKDKDLIGPDADGAVANIIEFGDVSVPISNESSSIPLYSLAFDIAPTGVVNLKLKCVGAKTAESDIKVTIAVDNSLLEKYNDENETEYEAMPASQYSLSTTEAVIKKGEREVAVPINLKPDQFTFDADYAVGLAIKTVSSGEISGNFGKIILNLGAKNFFDGVYKYTTSANTALVPNANKTVKLVTIGSNKCMLDPGLLGTYSNQVNYTIDQATNKITVEMFSLLPIATKSTSVYDPATKTLTVNWTSNGGARTFEEKFVYTGSR
ncbi:DUF1735 domain-containing protein [Sphingobacterium siyangense]|uniref:DUF1735 domain-containing protein n=1 Tax=Sphingobacterium siyangense TaxID=459529 RepID=UPI00200BFD8E|nr:DUF1735 domain-containing protein [Sphingobacterium siyangense]UQA76509.1 DUF1735 domain-containing protein [Sphingobacterium siyangense]